MSGLLELKIFSETATSAVFQAKKADGTLIADNFIDGTNELSLIEQGNS